MRGEFELFRPVEVAKAIRSLATGKATGPDGFPAELFKGLPALWTLIGHLFNCIVGHGSFPIPLRRLFIIPLDKPGRDPESCGSKRPISLICSLSKALEDAVYHRLLEKFEPLLDSRQYAYRRARGTEMHLLEMHTFVTQAQAEGDFIYLASIDVDSAFDAVPHASLVATFEQAGTDTYLCRYIHKWLVSRSFKVRLTSPLGCFYSTHSSITRGLPQGGVLSPFLWIVHINPLLSRVEKRVLEAISQAALEGLYKLCFLPYADDLVHAARHRSVGPLKQIATSTADVTDQELAMLGLSSKPVKSKNFIVPPLYTHSRYFRRLPNAFREGVLGLRKRDEELEQARSQEQEAAAESAFMCTFTSIQEGLPFPFSPSIKILGVVLDMRFCFEA